MYLLSKGLERYSSAECAELGLIDGINVYGYPYTCPSPCSIMQRIVQNEMPLY